MNKREMNYYQRLRTMTNLLLKDPDRNIQSVEEFKKTEECKNDPYLQLIAASIEALYLNIKGENKNAIDAITKTITRATELNCWTVLAFCYNLLGIEYSSLGFFDKAYLAYSMIIQIEEAHGLNNMKMSAYNNIGILFERLGDNTAAVDYFYKALQLDLQNDSSDSTQRSYPFITVSNYIIELCKNSDTKKAKIWLDNINYHDWQSCDLVTLSAIYAAFAYYSVQTHNYKKSMEYYEKLQGSFTSGFANEDMYRKAASYARFCKDRGVPYRYYIKYLQKYEDSSLSEFSASLAQINYILNGYYTSIAHKEKMLLTFKNYMKFSEINKENDKKQQLKALHVMLTNEHIMQENISLNKLTKELEEKNNALALAGKRLDIVMQIGRKITATLNLDEITEVIHNYINEIVPVDFFVIFIANEAETALYSIKIIEEGVEYNNLCVLLSDEKSYAVRCYKKSSTIIIDDISQIQNTQSMRGNGNTVNANSAMFIPITYEQKTIGVFTLQSVTKDYFKAEHERFFELIGQYLAIAINNVTYSQKLKDEIASHKETQKKLEAANEELKKLAVIDELTNIYNRREFYHAYLKLTQKAVKTKQPISVFMLDIDKFKKLNDCYGHLEGDKALIAVAQTIQKVITKQDTVIARFGGEEFIAVSVGENDREILEIAEKIRTEVRALNIENKETDIGFLTISIGVVTSYRPEIESRSDLLKRSDDCLYAAKNKGRNQVKQAVIYPVE